MSELVERTGVPAATVRYYLANGLLPPPVRAASNRFLYDERHVELVRLIRLLRDRRQLSLDAIAGILPDLLPDLLGRPAGVFRPEMWGRLLCPPTDTSSTEVVGARVLQAAVVAFSRHGYFEVTLDEVCRAAGIAKGSLYRHFASKEELFFAAARSAGASSAARLAASRGAFGAAPDELALAEALAPELGILLDLAALAARQRSGAGEVLAEVLETLDAAVVAHHDGAGGGRAVSVAVGVALRGLSLAPALGERPRVAAAGRASASSEAR